MSLYEVVLLILEGGFLFRYYFGVCGSIDNVVKLFYLMGNFNDIWKFDEIVKIEVRLFLFNFLFVLLIVVNFLLFLYYYIILFSKGN